jgi:hypothetical protein
VKFFLGSHMPSWLSIERVPLFVSDRRLRGRKRVLRKATCDWALDSGGFTEVSQHGKYTTTAAEYAARARRYSDEVGRLCWAAPQDWMCEPFVIAKTGLTVAEHQRRTIRSLVDLRGIEPGIRWAPVLQGWKPEDYFDHVAQYADAGVDLKAEAIVGVGSVCRRQGTAEGERIFRTLFDRFGLNLHGFGLKIDAIRRYADVLESADSLAWSFRARKIGAPAFPECVGRHVTCGNCRRYAMAWRDKVINGGGSGRFAFDLFAKTEPSRVDDGQR